MSRNLVQITAKQLKTLIDNSGQYKKFYVELGHDSVYVNFKHIRPRKIKKNELKELSVVREPVKLQFD